MVPEDPAEPEAIFRSFKRLLAELIRGDTERNTFQAWEIGLMLDFRECGLSGKRRLEILRQYERAVYRQLESGSGPPMMLSEFLREREERRLLRLRSSEPSGPRFDTGRSTPSV